MSMSQIKSMLDAQQGPDLLTIGRIQLGDRQMLRAGKGEAFTAPSRPPANKVPVQRTYLTRARSSALSKRPLAAMEGFANVAAPERRPSASGKLPVLPCRPATGRELPTKALLGLNPSCHRPLAKPARGSPPLLHSVGGGAPLSIAPFASSAPPLRPSAAPASTAQLGGSTEQPGSSSAPDQATPTGGGASPELRPDSALCTLHAPSSTASALPGPHAAKPRERRSPSKPKVAPAEDPAPRRKDRTFLLSPSLGPHAAQKVSSQLDIRVTADASAATKPTVSLEAGEELRAGALGAQGALGGCEADEAGWRASYVSSAGGGVVGKLLLGESAVRFSVRRVAAMAP